LILGSIELFLTACCNILKVPGVRFQVSAPPRAWKAARRIENETSDIYRDSIDCGSGLQARFTRSGIYLWN